MYDKTKDYQPFKYLAPESTAPIHGYIGTTTYLRTEMVNVGSDTCEFQFSPSEMNAMDRGTLTFRAKDSGGGIAIKKCSVSGLKMVITLERRVIQFGAVQTEWKTGKVYNW